MNVYRQHVEAPPAPEPYWRSAAYFLVVGNFMRALDGRPLQKSHEDTWRSPWG